MRRAQTMKRVVLAAFTFYGGNQYYSVTSVTEFVEWVDILSRKPCLDDRSFLVLNDCPGVLVGNIEDDDVKNDCDDNG